MKLRFLVLVATAAIPTAAMAAITTTMNAWSYIPVVQISQGNSYDCNGNHLVYNQSMSQGFSMAWPGSGDNGEDICWRRSSDPSNPSSQLGPWTRCASSSSLVCTID